MDDKNQPLVSVVVAAYNQESVVEASIKSILDQTYLNIEVIISDDCSNDRTALVINNSINSDKRVMFYRQESNVGITANYNFLVSKCNGKYIALFAGDDIMHPEKIERQVQLLEANDSASFCHHAVEILDHSSGRVTGVVTHKYNSGVTTIIDVIRNFGIPGSMSVMYRRSLMTDPVFNSRIRTASDWLHIIELCSLGDGLYLDSPLCKYRRMSDYNGKDPFKYENDFVNTILIAKSKFPSVHGLDDACDYAMNRYKIGRAYRLISSGFVREGRNAVEFRYFGIRHMLVGASLYLISFLPKAPYIVKQFKKIGQIIAK
ncbi:MAG: glycosyltransferase [Thermaerobacter sp.]|nr:glycosyltransferase [Thermaerobacter sp.]